MVTVVWWAGGDERRRVVATLLLQQLLLLGRALLAAREAGTCQRAHGIRDDAPAAQLPHAQVAQVRVVQVQQHLQTDLRGNALMVGETGIAQQFRSHQSRSERKLLKPCCFLQEQTADMRQRINFESRNAWFMSSTVISHQRFSGTQ